MQSHFFSIGGLYKILGPWNGDESGKDLTYEEKVQKLDEILTRFYNSETPIESFQRMSSSVRS